MKKRCKKCGELLADHERYEKKDGDWLCHQCHENKTITCPECDGTGNFLFFFSCPYPVCLGRGEGKKTEFQKNRIDFHRMLIAKDYQLIF